MRAIITAMDPDAAVAAISAMVVSPDDTPLLDAAEWISGHFGKDDVMLPSVRGLKAMIIRWRKSCVCA